jgi:hypothetical protein
MRVLIRTSKWAIWARRFGSFAFPLAILSVWMHRQGVIESAGFQLVAVLTMACAALGLGLGLVAFVRLWFTGDRGWGRAVTGVMLGVICLAPVAYAAYQSRNFPAITDLTTDPVQPLVLAAPLVPPVLDAEQLAQQVAAFPNLIARRYALDAPRVFALAEELAVGQGWEIVTARAPAGAVGQGAFTANVVTLLGWRDAVGVRVSGDREGSIVDMRSASTHALPDLGENGRRVEGFLAALDVAVTTFLRENPEAPGDTEPTAPVQGER